MRHMHSQENKPMPRCLDAGSCFPVQNNDTEIKSSVMAGLLQAESSKHPQLLFSKNRLPLKIEKTVMQFVCSLMSLHFKQHESYHKK